MEKKTQKIILIASVVIAVLIVGILIFSAKGLKQTKDTVTVEAGQELKLNAADFFEASEEELEKIEMDVSEVDTNKVGEYEVIARYKNKKYSIFVKVEDTTAPMPEFINRYVFLNSEENFKPEELVEVYDASDYEVQFVYSESIDTIGVLDDAGLKALTDTLVLPCDQDKLKGYGENEFPETEGIYRSVLAFTDEYDNKQLEEVILIVDKTGALIEDVEDKAIKVATIDLEKEPTVNPADYSVVDNVDGKVASDKIDCEVSVKDAASHTYTVHVSYTDRAGNKSSKDFTIILQADDVEANAGNNSGSNGGSSNGGSGGSNGSSGGTSNGGSGGLSGSSGGSSIPGDTNGDGELSGDEAYLYIDPLEQMLIDAGYGVVVLLPNGRYGVLVHSDGCADGKLGGEIILEYLEALGLYTKGASGWAINEENDWYCCVSDEVFSIEDLEWD